MSESSRTEALVHPERRTTWLGTAERGTLLGIRVITYLATAWGRLPARVLVRFIALWYTLRDAPARQASRQWWTVIDGRPPSWGKVYRHILRFAQTALDRLFLVRGHVAPFVVTRTGHHHLEAAKAAGTGGILLGAHLGSFEAMRAGGDNTDLKINILGFFENARMINSVLESLNPRQAARVIHIGRESVDFIFRAQQCIEAGEFVAVLGDRTGLHEKSITVEFFGRPARFPTGPFTLAAALKCPVLLTFGLYSEPNRYDLHCEVFCERVVLPRKDRQDHLRALVQRYAARLEHYCRMAPDNWFNFFDFWELDPVALPAGAPPPAAEDLAS